MRKVRYLLLAAFVAACCGGAVSGCGKEDADSDSAGKKRVSVLMKVGTRSVDAADGTPTDAEAALHTLRVYAFVGDERVGYYYSDGGLEASAAFLMDMTLKSTSGQKVDFYVVANEAAMVTLGVSGGLSETTTPAQLRQFRFTQLDLSKGLPMYCMTTETIDVATDDPNNPPAEPGHEDHTLLAQKLEFELRRPVAKLGVFAAKRPDEAAELRITGLTMLEQGTRMHNYLMPQDRAVLEQVQSMSAPLELDPVTAAVGELTVPATATEEEARRNPANYTPVLDTPFYPFENPWGNGGSWDIPGDEQGNVLKIDYEFGGESRTGLIFLPAMERNRYYTVCCLISNTGKFTVEYMVADWEEGDSWDDLIFDYPSYTNPLSAELTASTVPAEAPTIFYNPDYDPSDDDTFVEGALEAQGSCSFFFQLSAPSGQVWTATLLDVSAADYSVTVYDAAGRKTDIPEASDEFYRIVVRALNDDPAYVGRIIRLGIAYTPTWEGMGTGSFLLINGSDGDIKWPCHSDGRQVPELIEIKQVAN